MTARRHDLTDLIGSRICHDLISPLGAISNGVELLSMSGAAPGPEMGLISESAANATARIRFFRIAFGSAGAGQRIGRPEITSILSALSPGGRLAIDWQPGGDQPRGLVKLAFLLIQCFECAMPWGGRLTIRESGGNWALAGEAERMKIDPALWQALAEPARTPELDAARVQFALAPLTARALGRRLAVEHGENSARVGF
jgi:histidine phosphotransferase ChpT